MSHWKQRPEGGGRFALWLIRTIARRGGRSVSRVLLYPITLYFLLVRLGHPPVLTVPQHVWSWFANLLNHGIVGGMFMGEYVLRRRLFPNRPYRNFVGFVRLLGALGPKFWRQLFD